MEKRKTGMDYRREYKELYKSLVSLEAHIELRLLDLVKNFSDAVISTIWEGDIVCENIITKDYFQSISIETKIEYIMSIEKWIADQHKHKQLKIQDNEKMED